MPSAKQQNKCEESIRLFNGASSRYNNRLTATVKYLPDGSLVRALEDWCQHFGGYHLNYQNRRDHSPAFDAVVDPLLVGADAKLTRGPTQD